MKLILIFAQAITQQEQIIGFFYEAIYMFFFGVITSVRLYTRVVAQEVSDYSQLSEEDYTKIVLPPLSVLFENAKNSPIYEMADVKARIERKLLQKEKWSFLGFFSLRGSYQYGMFGNESTYTDVALAPYLTYSTQHKMATQ